MCIGGASLVTQKLNNAPANAGEAGQTSGLGRPPGEGNGKPLQDSCLENSMDRGNWQATIPWGHKELDITE